MAAVAMFMYVLRGASSIVRPSLIADDGFFFKDALARGWGALFDGYNGQLFLLARAVAAAAASLPVFLQPAVYVSVGVGAAVLSCSIVLSSRWRSSVPRWARYICMLALLCSPAVDNEVFGPLADAHWWLGLGLLILAMLKDPISRWLKIGEVTFTALAATSGFAALYGLPCLVVRAYRNRSRHSLSLLCVAVAGIVVQVGYVLASSRRGNPAMLVGDPHSAILVLIKRQLAVPALGQTSLQSLWASRLPELIVWPIVVVLVVAIALALLRAGRLEALALTATFLGSWLLALWALSQPGDQLDHLLWPHAASRYFLAPVGAIYVSLVLSWPSGLIQRMATVVACLILATGIISDYQLALWPAADWAPFAACIDRGTTTCTTVIPPGWPLQVNPRAR